MPRKPRIEYAGAVYHVMCRGNARESIFYSDRDRELFLDTLDEVCGRCGWKIHAFVLMSNHYHLLLETPEPNLVSGMKWFQGTYTQRFNRHNNRVGHLFQGRYKALSVEASVEYFVTVADYIHLNPARAGLFNLKKGRLQDYLWSSYPHYLKKASSPVWLCTERVLDGFHGNCVEKRMDFAEHMAERVQALSLSKDPSEFVSDWKQIRRGWCFGGDNFRKKITEHIGVAISGKDRGSFSGEQIRRHDHSEAEHLVQLGMASLGLEEDSLGLMKKNCPEKYAIALIVRRNTCVRNDWIKRRLEMGKATNFATFLKNMESGDFGAEQLEKVRNIKS